MALDRIKGCPFELQVQSFYDAIDDLPHGAITVSMASGGPYRSYFPYFVLS